MDNEMLFQRALALVLKHEGGWSDDPIDPGGATHYGISLRYLRGRGDLARDDIDHDGDIDRDDVRKMTPDHAALIYRQDWWQRYGYGRLPDDLAVKMMDTSVNLGAGQAHKLLQRAVNSLNPAAGLADDGVLGPKTMAAACAINDQVALLSRLRALQGRFYEDLIARRPAFEKYRKGWLRRAAA